MTEYWGGCSCGKKGKCPHVTVNSTSAWASALLYVFIVSDLHRLGITNW